MSKKMTFYPIAEIVTQTTKIEYECLSDALLWVETHGWYVEEFGDHCLYLKRTWSMDEYRKYTKLHP